jgi:hypothetical protein
MPKVQSRSSNRVRVGSASSSGGNSSIRSYTPRQILHENAQIKWDRVVTTLASGIPGTTEDRGFDDDDGDWDDMGPATVEDVLAGRTPLSVSHEGGELMSLLMEAMRNGGGVAGKTCVFLSFQIPCLVK